jgi:hypothetical protein
MFKIKEQTISQGEYFQHSCNLLMYEAKSETLGHSVSGHEVIPAVVSQTL